MVAGNTKTHPKEHLSDNEMPEPISDHEGVADKDKQLKDKDLLHSQNKVRLEKMHLVGQDDNYHCWQHQAQP